MFQPQMRPGAPGMHPAVMQSQSDVNARDKLTTYIYEYLSISGATKTAETFKEEVLNNNPSTASVKPPEKGPSFLLDWWLLFWDLYCAAPERRDQPDGCSAEAKYFHDNFIGNFGPPGMNGVPPFGAPGMMPGHDGMMGMHPGAPGFPGRFPPARGMPGAMGPGFGMFPGDPRMGRMPPNAMRMPPGQFPGGPPGQMRPGPNAMTPGMPPRGYGGFMESPGAPPPFPGASGMMPNGAVMGGPMAMSSPGMHPAPTDGSGGFMSLGMPTSSSAMPFGMDPAAALGNGSGPGPSVDGLPTGSIPATSLINGEDIKQSPVSTPRGAGLAGGTPAPGSAQSGALQQPVTPAANTPTQPMSNPSQDSKEKDDSEISKIKEGLLDGFMKDEPGGESFFS